MYFASDNSGPVHPKVMEALVEANAGYAMGYGNDPSTLAAIAAIREAFEAPDAAVFLVPTGTAANALLLACMAKPWETIYCTDIAHIHVDECSAPEFYAGGATLTLVPHRGGRLDAELLRAAMSVQGHGVHGAQPGPVSITQVTERGSVHSLDELRGLTALAHARGVKTHLDGARFANACAALGCSAADMSWKAGIDAVSFGGTKNGLMGVEAAVIFDPASAWEFELRRKRGGHLFSKGRYLGAQMQAYMTDGLWLELAARANAACARLYAGMHDLATVTIAVRPQANMIYFDAARSLHQRLQSAGAVYYIEVGQIDGDDPAEILTGRLVCDWSVSNAAIDRFLGLLTA
jgi:threonine aldolase